MDDKEQLRKDIDIIKQDIAQIKSMLQKLVSTSGSIIQKPIKQKAVQFSCINCGTIFPSTAKFCTTCGYSPDTVQQEKEISFKDTLVVKRDIVEGLKFNYRSLIKVSQSSSFTMLAMQITLIAALFSAASFVVNMSIMVEGEGTTLDGMILFNNLFYGFIITVVTFAFLLEYSLKNMHLKKTTFTNSIRLTGLLSILLLIRGGLSIVYNIYIYLVAKEDVNFTFYFFMFETISYGLIAVLLIIYLIIFLKNRAAISGLFSFVIIVICASFTALIFISFFLDVFNLFFQYELTNYIGIGVAILLPIIAQIKKKLPLKFNNNKKM